MSYTQQLFESLRRMDTPSSSVAAALFTTPSGYGSGLPTPAVPHSHNPYAQQARHVTFAPEDAGQRWEQEGA